MKKEAESTMDAERNSRILLGSFCPPPCNGITDNTAGISLLYRLGLHLVVTEKAAAQSKRWNGCILRVMRW